MTQHLPTLIAIVGPTAAGKTALSIDLAETLGGEIVSADSRQIDRGMDIGGSEANLWKFYEWAKGTSYHEIIYKNQFMKDGRRVPGIGNHDDHLHYSF